MYKKLDTRITTDLFMLRKYIFNPEYKLTNKVDSYGKLFYKWFSVRKATAITADATWLFERKGLFSQTQLIKDESGIVIGELTSGWFSRDHSLTMRNGFSAKFFKPSIWSNRYVWVSEQYGTILSLRKLPFSFKDTVHIKQSTAPVSIISLLIFLGMHLTVLSRRGRAAHY